MAFFNCLLVCVGPSGLLPVLEVLLFVETFVDYKFPTFLSSLCFRSFLSVSLWNTFRLLFYFWVKIFALLIRGVCNMLGLLKDMCREGTTFFLNFISQSAGFSFATLSIVLLLCLSCIYSLSFFLRALMPTTSCRRFILSDPPFFLNSLSKTSSNCLNYFMLLIRLIPIFLRSS